MGPLSAKQHREYLKLQADEQRKEKAFALDQERKNQLFGIKLQEQAAKASQSIGHKEDAHKAKMKDMGVPPLKINRQKLGLPSTNPLAGMEVFKQGQHKLSEGTDTVPAMLTPGEAVIPEPAAQDPKNKKAIKRMVKEGREANRKKLRDGTVNIVKTDSSVPRPTAGNYGGVPQQVQQAAGYMDGTQRVPAFPYADGTPEVPNVLGGVIGVAQYVDGETEVPLPDVVVTPVPMPSESTAQVIPPAEVPPVEVPPVEKLTPQQIEANVAKPFDIPTDDQSQAEINRLSGYESDAAWAETPAEENKVIPVAPGDMKAASSALQSRVKSIDEYMKMQGYDDSAPKDEKGFIDSFKNAFTFSGAKEALGLNNQEIARLAIMTLGGRIRGYDMGRSLAFAGRQAFMESSKRQAQEDADRKAAMRNAVTMRQQDIRQEIADKRAEAKEQHDRFVAQNQREIAEAKERYLRDRDDKRFAQQMALLQQSQAAQDARMAAQFGNQWRMMIAREELRENNPQRQAERYQKLVGQTGDTINSILNSQFGSDTRKVSTVRQVLPTAGEMTNQAYGYFRRSGYNVNDVDSTMAMNSIMAMATRDMASDAAAGKLSKGTADITPYVAKYVIQFRTGLDSSLFKVDNNKDMNPEKIVNLEQQAIVGSASPEAARAKLNALAIDWKNNGAKYRKEYSGSSNESAFYQWANSQLSKQNKKESK